MYNKLFAKIVDSSIWLEPDQTRIVWFMFIALMNEDGFVQFASIANVAHRARISHPKASEALKILESPDPNSSDDDNDGRRIERVPGGWVVLNAHKYRDLVTREMVREQTRQRVARHRAKVNGNAPVTPCNAVKRKSNDFASDSVSKSKCTQKEAEDFCASIGLPRSDGRAMWLHFEEKKWVKIRDWKLTIRKWREFGYLPSQKQRKNGARRDDPAPTDKSKVELPERFKSWAAGKFPDRREAIMKWQTWADVPNNGMRSEWWNEQKQNLPGEIGELI